MPDLETLACLTLYAIALSLAGDRWLPSARIGSAAIWLFALTYAHLFGRRARREGAVVDRHTVRGRREVERIAWRVLLPSMGLGTLLLVPFALFNMAMAPLNWWQTMLAGIAVVVITGVLGRLRRAWRA